MWRWVTRGLVLAVRCCVARAGAPRAARISSAVLDSPDPAVTQSGHGPGQGLGARSGGRSRRSSSTSTISSSIDSTRDLPRIDVVEAYPNYPGIQQHRARIPDRLPGQPLHATARTRSTCGLLRATTASSSSAAARSTSTTRSTSRRSAASTSPISPAAYNACGSFPVAGWALTPTASRASTC